jgi:PAS domain S-box-containing protein
MTARERNSDDGSDPENGDASLTEAFGDREQELRTITDALPVLVSYIGPDHRYRFVNNAYEQWFRCHREETVGAHMRDVLGDAAYRALIPHLDRALSGQEDRFEARVPYRDGERFIDAVYIPHRVGDRVEGLIALVSDVSERKELELAGLAVAERTQRLVTITAAMTSAVGADEVYEAVVDRVADTLRARSVELWLARGSEVATRVHSFGPTLTNTAVMALDSTFPSPVLDAFRRAEPIWAADATHACLPLLVEGRTMGALFLTFEPALARRSSIDENPRDFLLLVAGYASQSLERLRLFTAERESRKRAELLYRLARIVISADGIDAVFEGALDALEQGSGAGRAAISTFDPGGALVCRASRGLSDDYRASVRSPWPSDARSPSPIVYDDLAAVPASQLDLDVRVRDRLVSATFVPLVSGGDLLGTLAIHLDAPRAPSPSDLDLAVAVANQLAAALTRFARVAQLEEAVRFNELFAGMLGHDLRNPLGAIAAAAHVATARNVDRDLVDPLARIESSSQRMARMVTQLLDFTRVRTGNRLAIDPTRVDLAALVRHVVDEVRYANPGAAIDIAHHGEVEGVWDADRLAQLFSNLVANAVQHGAGELVSISIDGRESSLVRVEIHNGGVVDADVRATIFEPMPTDRRHKSQGLGLGLHISREIARAHGGRIELRSESSLGTTFTVFLPRAADEEIRVSGISSLEESPREARRRSR